jgi:hypothetical protein
MIYDHAPAIMPPVLIAPEAMPAKKGRSRKTSRIPTALIVGMIIIMDDGEPCRIVWIDADGTAWCAPVAP